MNQYRVSIIGSGNVATHLALTLFKNGVDIGSVYSQNLENAKSLADRVAGKGVDDYGDIDFEVDFLILAIKDDAIASVVEHLPKSVAVLHTSGSISIQVLSSFQAYGILYPLQTFSKTRGIDMTEVPFFIEANDDVYLAKVKTFVMATLSQSVYKADSEVRKTIHLAAVFANNFSTQLMVEASGILATKGLDISIFKPLMTETFDKIFEQGALAALTGPAKRNDEGVIQNQLSSIASADLKAIYTLLTARIKAQFKT